MYRCLRRCFSQNTACEPRSSHTGKSDATHYSWHTLWTNRFGASVETPSPEGKAESLGKMKGGHLSVR